MTSIESHTGADLPVDERSTDLGSVQAEVPPEPAGGPILHWVAHHPVAVLVAAVGLYVAFVGAMTWRQHANFGTSTYDMGIYDQAIWLLSRFREPFLTVRGMNYFGHHGNYSTVLFVPAYWLGAGPQFLSLVQTVVLALGAVPIWLLARDRLRSEWAAVALAVSYLLHPTLSWINRWDFHPDALLITPLVFGYWFATHRRWWWFALCLVLAALTKEDVALAIAALGVVLLIRRWWRPGILVLAGGLVWFFTVTKLLIPRANGGLDAFYGELFEGYGQSAPEIVRTILGHPGRLLRDLTERSRSEYVWHMLAPVAFMPVLGGAALLVALPQLLVIAISSHTWARRPDLYYSAIPLAVIFVATVEGCARMPGRELQRRMVGLVLLASFVAQVAWGLGPFGRRFGDEAAWAQPRPELQKSFHRAIDLVPADAGVSASRNLVPWMTHRVHVYDWPEPFVLNNWGMKGSPPPDPAAVGYVVVDRTDFAANSAGVLERLTGPSGEYEIVYESGPVVVAERLSRAPA